MRVATKGMSRMSSRATAAMQVQVGGRERRGLLLHAARQRGRAFSIRAQRKAAELVGQHVAVVMAAPSRQRVQQAGGRHRGETLMVLNQAEANGPSCGARPPVASINGMTAMGWAKICTASST